ncbi:MAG: MFS transporter, partial [Chitinophagaceae bacterium]
NNLNDAMLWGLLPILLLQKHFTLTETGSIIAVYPAVWGITQILTGKLSDVVCKKSLLFWGMLIQAIALFLLIIATHFSQFIAISTLLGLGTAFVYPTFMASIADNTHPADRAESIGVFRLWRDLGYAFGAILTGFLADQFNLSIAITGVAGLTLLSAFIIQFRMGCSTHHPKLSDVLKPIKINYTKQ